MRVVRRARRRARPARLLRHRRAATRRRPRHRRRRRTPTTGSSVASTIPLSARPSRHASPCVGATAAATSATSSCTRSSPASPRPTPARSRWRRAPFRARRAGAFERAPGLPLTARRLDGGRSAWKPSERGPIALVFDDRSGAIVGRLRRNRRDAGDARSLGRGALGLRHGPLAARRGNGSLHVHHTARSGRRARVAASDHGRDRASRRRLSGAARLLQRSEEDGALSRRRQPAPRRRRRRRDRRSRGRRRGRLGGDRRSLPRLALHRHAARRRPLVRPRHAERRRLDDRRRPAASVASAAMCLRRQPRSMRTSRLPTPTSMSAPPCSGATFLVVGASERCPSEPRTEPHPP